MDVGYARWGVGRLVGLDHEVPSVTHWRAVDFKNMVSLLFNGIWLFLFVAPITSQIKKVQSISPDAMPTLE